MKYRLPLLISLPLVVLCTASPVLADNLLERLEVATEKIGANQGAFYASRVPELKDKMPDWNWDDEIRAASKCVLDGIEVAKGRDVTEAYVAALEKDSEMKITSFTQLSDQSSIPKELLGEDQTIITLMQSCKTIEISAARLKASGFLDEMLKPEVIGKLTAE